MAEAPLPPAVLVVDDDAQVLTVFRKILLSTGIPNVVCTDDSRQALQIARAQDIAVALLDLSMPNLPGEELLRTLKEEQPSILTIIVTGNNEIDKAVECMRAGAFDYLVKAVESQKLIATVKRALEIRELRMEIGQFSRHLHSRSLENPEAFAEIISRDSRMTAIFSYIEVVARTHRAVLITGETGTGKELVARAIHAVSGCSGVFMPVNIAGFDDIMFSDTLFGHRKGSFTGADQDRAGLVEMASGGTLFLDEIGDLSVQSQVKLLRLLDEEEYFPLGWDVPRKSHARIVVATNRPLEKEVDAGRFRKDLYYRLKTHWIHLPPLRERKGDLPPLIDHFLRQAAEELEKPKPAVPDEIVPLLNTYDFPGNVRELRSLLFDAVSRHSGGVLSLGTIRRAIGSAQPVSRPAASRQEMLYPERLPTLKQSARLLVAEAMRRAGGNQSIAARLLGISQQALSKRLAQRELPDDPGAGGRLERPTTF